MLTIKSLPVDVYIWTGVALSIVIGGLLYWMAKLHNARIDLEHRQSVTEDTTMRVHEVLSTFAAWNFDIPVTYTAILSNLMHELSEESRSDFRITSMISTIEQLKAFLSYLGDAENPKRFVFYITNGTYYLVDTRDNSAGTSSTSSTVVGNDKLGECQVMDAWLDKTNGCLKLRDSEGTMHLPARYIAAFKDKQHYLDAVYAMEIRDYGSTKKS